MRVPVLFAFEKFFAHHARHKKLPGGTDEFSLQVEGIIPNPTHQTLHANAPIRVPLPTVGTEFCLVGQWVIAIATIFFH